MGHRLDGVERVRDLVADSPGDGGDMMASQRRRYCLRCILSVGLVALATLIPAGGAEARVTAALLSQTSDYRSIAPLLEQWAKSRGVELEIIGFTSADFERTWISAWEAGSDRFDFVQVDQSGSLARFVEGGYVIPLDGSYDPAIRIPAELMEDYFPAVRELLMYKGVPYKVQYSTDANPFFYRKDLFANAGIAEPPRTWADLVNYAKKLTSDTNGDGIVDRWGFSWWLKPQVNSIGMWFFNLLYSEGGQLIDSAGRLAFDSDAGVRALTFMNDLMNTHKVSPPASLAWFQNELYQAALNGQVAMWQAGAWVYSPLNLADESPIKGRVGVAMFPSGSVRAAVMLGGNGFLIASSSRNKQLAWDAIQYLVSHDAQIFMSQMGLDYSARQSIYFDASVRARAAELYEAYYNIIGHGYVIPAFPESSRVEEIVANHAHRVLVGLTTPQQALRDAREEIRREMGL